MNIPQLREELIRDEGFKPYAYKDHLGFLTIGVGRMIDERKSGGITPEEAHYLLENDIGRAVDGLRKALPFWDNLSDARQRALCNMAFQMGVSGVLKFTRMIAALKIGHYDRAALEALDSTWAKQTPERAQRVTRLIREG